MRKIILLAFVFALLIPVYNLTACADSGYSYEQMYQIKKNYRLRFESAIKNALNNKSLKIQNGMALTGDISAQGKLTNIKLVKSAENKNIENIVLNSLKSLNAMGAISPNEFMPESFNLFLYPAPKYSNENFAMVFEMYNNLKYSYSTLEWNAYLRGIESAIQSNWNPKNLNNNTLKITILRFYIKRTGEIDDIIVIKTSDDRAFDNLAVETIRKSSPLAPLPSYIKGDSKFIDYSLTNREFLSTSGNDAKKKTFWEKFSELNNDYYLRYQNMNPWM